MTAGGADALKAAVRRSIIPVLILMIVGIATVTLFKQLQGPEYSASASVLVPTTPISRIVTGTEPPFIDPQRVEETERALARARGVFKLAAARTGGRLGSAGELRASSSLGGSNEILSFNATSTDADRAVGIANAIARAYIIWRGRLTGAALSRTIKELRARLRQTAPGAPGRSNLEQDLNRLQLLRTLQAGDAVLVNEATSAGKIAPAPKHDAILGAALGLVIGLLLAALREAVDTRVRSESDIEEALAVPVLATVRTLPRRTRMVTFGRHERVFADTYALMAANLAHAVDESKHVVVAVTSSVSREGKTTTAGNLAVSLARRGANVLLADFDFRKPNLHQLFEIPESAPGTLQILSGKTRLEETLWTVGLEAPRAQASRNGAIGVLDKTSSRSRDGRNGVLHLLPAGGVARPDGLARSAGPAKLLSTLRSRYDFVILDTSPALLTVEMTELGRLIDLAVVVVRQGHVSVRALRALGRQAQTWPAELVGAVLTDAPSEEAYAADYYGR